MRLCFPRFLPCGTRAAQGGFSLVELSVVVVIISIVATAGLEGMAAYLGRTAYTTTADKLAVIDQALADYRRVHRALPCPSYWANSNTSICYGKQANATGGNTTCANTTGTCNADTLNSGNLYIGDVPVRDLNLPISYMTDSYGSRIRYVVTKNMVATSSYDTASDGIVVRSGKLDTVCTGSTNRCQNRGTAAYFVYSVGKDRRGGVAPTGGYHVACFSGVTNDGMVDTVNCRDNYTTALKIGSTSSAAGTTVTIPSNVFYDSRFNSGTIEDNRFDDIVRWRSKSNL